MVIEKACGKMSNLGGKQKLIHADKAVMHWWVCGGWVRFKELFLCQCSLSLTTHLTLLLQKLLKQRCYHIKIRRGRCKENVPADKAAIWSSLVWFNWSFWCRRSFFLIWRVLGVALVEWLRVSCLGVCSIVPPRESLLLLAPPHDNLGPLFPPCGGFIGLGFDPKSASCSAINCPWSFLWSCGI